jgi:RNA polymerase sigma factor (sigma-70 family)
MPDLPEWVRNPQDETDVRLIERAAANDPRGWEELYARYSERVREYCRRKGLPEPDVDDVCQEVFWSVSKTIAQFRREHPRDSFRAWLHVITKRRVADFYRWSEKDLLHQAEHERDLTNLARIVEGPCSQEQRERLAAALRQVRQRVQPRTWRVFTAHVLRGVRAKDVGEAYGLHPTAVLTARARVLACIRQELGEFPKTDLAPEDWDQWPVWPN